MKKSILFILVCIFIFSNLSFAKNNTKKINIKPMAYSQEYLDYLSSGSKTGYMPLVVKPIVKESFKTGISSLNCGSLPESYTAEATPVRDQGEYGTCWAFSTMASLESSLLHEGYDELIFSPLHLANKSPFGKNLTIGGSIYDSMAYFSHLIGPVEEKDNPYASPWTSPNNLTRAGVCYKAEMVDDGKAGLTIAEIEDIKNKIYNDGAVQASIYFNYGSDGSDNYNENYDFFNNWFDEEYEYFDTYYLIHYIPNYKKLRSYYCYNESFDLNHGITIVGWDDNYDKSNFKHTPEDNGAFLVKNSYGTDIHNNGYFWLSYYDKNIEQVIGYSYKPNEEIKYTKVYSPCDTCMVTALSDYKYGKIILTAKESGYIYGIQLYNINNSNNIIKAEIKINNELVRNIKENFNYFGYKNIDIEPLIYNSGDTIELYLDYDSAAIPIESNIAFYNANENKYLYYKPTVKENTNFASMDGRDWDKINCNIAAGLLVKPTIFPTTLKLNKTSVNLPLNNYDYLIASIEPENAEDKTITWSSSNPKVVSVYPDGRITGLKTGTATITAKTYNGLTATCSVKVYEVYANSISLNPTYKYIPLTNNIWGQVKAQSFKINATITPTNTSNKQITWSSSNTNVATVDNNGNVTVINGGYATITAKTSNGKTAYCTINAQVIPRDITLNKSLVTLKKNKSYQLSANVYPYNTTNKSVKWSSSNTNIATVNQNGRVTAKRCGVCSITAKTWNGLSRSCTFIVY